MLIDQVRSGKTLSFSSLLSSVLTYLWFLVTWWSQASETVIGTFIISQTLWGKKTNGKAVLQPKKTQLINQINHRYWSILTHFGSPACAASAAPGAAAYPAHKACFQQLLSPGVQTVQLLHGTYRDQEQFTLSLNNSTSLIVAFKCDLQKLRIQHWWKQLFVFKWNSFRYITNLKTLHIKYLSLDQEKKCDHYACWC